MGSKINVMGSVLKKLNLSSDQSSTVVYDSISVGSLPLGSLSKTTWRESHTCSGQVQAFNFYIFEKRFFSPFMKYIFAKVEVLKRYAYMFKITTKDDISRVMSYNIC